MFWSVKLIRQRRRKNNLLKKARKLNSSTLLEKSREQDRKLRSMIKKEHKNKIRKIINPADQSSFWKAISRAKSQESKTTIPLIMAHEGLEHTTMMKKPRRLDRF